MTTIHDDDIKGNNMQQNSGKQKLQCLPKDESKLFLISAILHSAIIISTYEVFPKLRCSLRLY